MKRGARAITPDSFGNNVVTEFGVADFEEKVLTNSARSTFLDCQYKFLMSYGYLLARRGIVDYFWIGGVYHDELCRMYTRQRFNRKASQKRIDRQTREAIKLCVNQEQEEKVWKASANLQGMVPVYADTFLEADLERFRVLEAEKAFDPIPIPGTEWKYAGQRDMAVRVRRRGDGYRRGEHGLVENKTSAQIGPQYVARLPLDFQILGYAWEMRESVADPEFVLYNAAQKSAIRGRQGEPFGSILDRIESAYREEPHRYFYRERLKVEDGAINQFVQELGMFVNNVLEPAIKSGYFAKNTRECTRMGFCDFIPICSYEVPMDDALAFFRRKTSMHEELEDGD